LENFLKSQRDILSVISANFASLRLALKSVSRRSNS